MLKTGVAKTRKKNNDGSAELQVMACACRQANTTSGSREHNLELAAGADARSNTVAPCCDGHAQECLAFGAS